MAAVHLEEDYRSYSIRSSPFSEGARYSPSRALSNSLVVTPGVEPVSLRAGGSNCADIRLRDRIFDRCFMVISSSSVSC